MKFNIGILLKCFTILVICSVAFLFYLLIEANVICTKDSIQKWINVLCDDANNFWSPFILKLNSNLSVNKMCKHICNKKNHNHINCHTFHVNKAIVFTLDVYEKGFTKIVVKSVTDDAEDNDDEDLYWNQNSHDPYIPTKQELINMVNSHVKSFLGLVPNNLRSIDTLLYSKSRTSLYDHKLFWTLIQDHEFLTAYLFQEHHIFPEIYGTCGNLYSMEYATPLFTNSKLSWKDRLIKGIQMVKYIENLELLWMQPIHLCDVKHDHFGWNEDKVLFLDLDAVITNAALQQIMVRTPSCASHEDCSFFDCHGRCLYTRKCSPHRANTNLQVLCQKIFLGISENSYINYPSLLNDEASSSLKDAAQLCRTNPGMTPGIMIEVLEYELNTIKESHQEL